MLNIFLMILKVLGIILAVLLGILVVLFLEVLWVPARYRIVAKKKDEIYAKVNVSWLLRFAYITFLYEKSKFIYIVRILGIPLIDSRRPKKEKKKKKQKQLQAKKKVKNSKVKKNTTKATVDSETSCESNTTIESKQTLVEDKNADSSDKKIDVEKEKKVAEDSKNTKHGMKYRIKRILYVIIHLPETIQSYFHKLKNIFIKAKKVLNTVIHFPSRMKVFIIQEENKQAFALILKSMKELLQHARPRKLKGELVFGLEDPCSTGQALGVMSLLYAYYGSHIKITPNFSEAKIEGEVYAKGRIVSVVALRIVLRLIRDKNVMSLKERFKSLKEE